MLLVLAAGVEDMHPVLVAVEVEALHLRRICFYEDDDDLLAGCRGTHGSHAGGLCQAPILACRSRSCRRRKWNLLHKVSMLTNHARETSSYMAGLPWGEGEGAKVVSHGVP